MSTQQLIYAILAMAVAMFICKVVPLFVFKNKIKNMQSRKAHVKCPGDGELPRGGSDRAMGFPHPAASS